LGTILAWWQNGIVAVVPLGSGGTSVTEIVEFMQVGSTAGIDEARIAFGNWLVELGGQPLSSAIFYRATNKVESTPIIMKVPQFDCESRWGFSNRMDQQLCRPFCSLLVGDWIFRIVDPLPPT
jgi:hypothetical protein